MQNNRLQNLLAMLENQPNDPFLIYAVGFEYQSGGTEAVALTYYNRLLQEFPNYLPAYYQTGMLLFEQGDNTKALEIFYKGVDLATELKENKTLRELREAVQMVEDEM